MIIFLLCIVLLLLPEHSYAGYYTGVSFDTSSNMLLRPDGRSGTLTSVYGGMQQNISRGSFSYSFDSGILQHYEGLQYHRHNIDFGYPIVRSTRGMWSFALEGSLARYGDVTVLRGYEEFGAASTVKYYLAERLLLRWEGGVSDRSYRDFSTENYTEYESFIRLDRFFTIGLTLRGQIDWGMRQYTDFDDSPYSSLIGFRLRAAKSLGPTWGIWAETYTSNVSDIDAPSDTTSVYDRLFLDDPYKYSKSGFVINIKHLLGMKGFVQLRSSYLVREYDGSLNSAYWYLPPEGWDEQEASVYLTLSYLPSWLSGIVIPSLDLYYIDVHASEDFLSYRSGGVTVRFTH